MKCGSGKILIRTPYYLDDKFAGFEYWNVKNRQCSVPHGEWADWVSKRHNLTPGEDELCTQLSDKIGQLIYANDLIKSPNNSHILIVRQGENGLWECWENRPGGCQELPLADLVRLYGVEIVGNAHRGGTTLCLKIHSFSNG